LDADEHELVLLDDIMRGIVGGKAKELRRNGLDRLARDGVGDDDELLHVL